MSLDPPALDDRLELRGRLGAGGMGEVHRAWDLRLERAVAVKFLRGADEREAERLVLEARLQARVEDPHVVRVHEVGTLGGRPCIVLQLVEGRSLAARAAGLPVTVRVELVRQAARGLHAAHLQGLIHRDVKPGNVLVDDSAGVPTALVSDFGLARGEEGGLTRSGFLPGTLAFMAPEQVLGSPVDLRADVYALGATLYAVLAGAPPFGSGATAGPGASQPEDPASLLRRILEVPPPPLDAGVPAPLRRVVQKAMEKEPGQRYRTAEALADDLGRFLRGEPVWAHPASLGERTLRWTRRNRLASRAIAAAVVAVLVGAGLAAWTSRRGSLEALEAARLGAEAERLALQLGAEQLLPPHDLRPALDRARATLRRLDEHPPELATGAAAFLRGRALQLLGDQEAALEPLRQAWALGHRLPEVAIALAEAEGERFAAERAEAARAEDEAARAALRHRAEVDWRDPARARLAALPGQDDVPGLVARARLAELEDRHDEAEALGWRAAGRDPSRLDAAVIALRAAEARAVAEAEAGALERARAGLLEAQRRGAEIMQVGRSSVALRVALANLHLRLATVDADGRQRAANLAAAQASCDEALALDAGSPAALEAAVAVAAARAKALYAAGGDPGPILEQERKRAELAVEAAPRSARAHHRLALVLQRRGLMLTTAGDADGSTLDGAIAEAQAARQLAPDWLEPVRLEAQLRNRRAWWDQEHGGDGGEDVAAALALARRLAEGDRRPITGRLLLAQTLQNRARRLQRSGGDPLPEYRTAWATLKEVALRAPGHPDLGPAVTDLLADWGDQALADGVDEDAAFAEGEALVRRWLAAHPDDRVERLQLANLLAYRALLPAFTSGPRQGPLREALAMLRGIDFPLARAELDRAVAEVTLGWARRTGRPEDAAAAEREARRALRLHPATTRTWNHLAGALLLRAAWLEGAARRAALEEAAAAVDRGAAAGWRTPEDQAVRGLVREGLAPGSGAADLEEARRRDPRLVILRERR